MFKNPFSQLSRVTFLAVLVVFCLPNNGFGEEAVVNIRGRSYTVKDMCGIKKETFRDSFRRAFEKLTEDELKSVISREGNRLAECAKISDKETQQDEMFQYFYHRFVKDVAVRYILAAAFDSLVAEHGIIVEDFISPEILKDAYEREWGFWSYLSQHKQQLSDKKMNVLGKASKKFGLKKPVSFLEQLMSDLFTPWCAWQDWHLLSSKHAGYRDAQIRAAMFYYLLEDACENGIFAERAKKEFELRRSVVLAINIDGYCGDMAQLEQFFALIIDKDGDVAKGGLNVLKSCFRATGTSGPTLARRNEPGSNRGSKTKLSLGQLVRQGDNSYEIISLAAKYSAAEAEEVFIKQLAQNIACEEYLPVFEPMREWLQIDVDEVRGTASVPGIDRLAPMVQVEDFIKQPYPASEFAEIEAFRPKLHNGMVEIAGATLRDDVEHTSFLMKCILEDVKKVESVAVRNQYCQLLGYALNATKIREDVRNEIEQVIKEIKTSQPPKEIDNY